MKITEVLSKDEISTMESHANYFGNYNPEWLLDALLWKGKDLDIRDFALLCIAHQLETLNDRD